MNQNDDNSYKPFTSHVPGLVLGLVLGLGRGVIGFIELAKSRVVNRGNIQ